MSSAPEGIAEAFAWVLERSWQATGLVIFLLVLRWVFARGLSPWWRHALWLVPVCLLILPELPECPLSVHRWKLETVKTGPLIALPVRSEPPPAILPSGGEMTGFQEENPGAPEPSAGWMHWAGLGWASVAAGLLAFFGVVNLHFHIRLRSNGRPVDARALRIFEACRRELGVGRSGGVVETDLIDSPATAGIFRPRVLVPSGFGEALSEMEIRWIFLHELTHLKRGDLLMNAVVAVLGALHWFNPILAWAFRQMRADREAACDEAVLVHIGGEHRQAYGKSLLLWMRGGLGRFRDAGLVGMSASRREVQSRIEQIARFGGRRRGWSIVSAVLFIGIAVTFLTRTAGSNAALGKEIPAANFARICDRNGVVLVEIEFTADGKTKARYPLGALAASLLAELDDAAKPKAGESICLTIDVRAQSVIENELRRVGRGAAVLLDPWNGDILAMASVPSFDPNGAFPVPSKTDLLDPRMNRALTAFTPGAVFLPVTALAAAAAGLDKETFECRGSLPVGKYTMKCWKTAGHGPLGLPEALKASCNVYFYHCGIVLGERVTEMAGHLGFGLTSGIPVRGEASGYIGNPEQPPKRFPSQVWSDGWAANRAIGQGDSQVTLLQVAVMMGTIGNGGTVYWPRLVKRVIQNGESREQPAARIRA
ncbi:MAG TPA: M56 family metallopeptidase, partial [Chthoniobacterales bacterium]